ncbi:MAG: YdcF family protein [Acetobacter sp.]
MAASSAIKRGPRRRNSLLRRAARMLALLACAVLAGLVWFAWDSLRPAGALPPADGIVALTGGTGRVETSLRLLAQNRARLLLISGVDTQTSLRALLPAAAPQDLAARVTLGYQARSTIENAAETATWVADNHIGSLIVVTAGYHMRRAMLELSRTLPDVALYPYPVTPPAMRHPFQPTSLRILAEEYIKWLGALVGAARNPASQE